MPTRKTKKLARAQAAMAVGVVVTAMVATGASAARPPTHRPAPTATPSADLAGKALQKISADQGIPLSRLSLVTRSASHLPRTGVSTVDFKVAASDGRTFAVSYDKATGQVIHPRALQRAEARSRLRAVGKSDDALVRHFAKTSSTAKVALWVSFADPGHLGRTPGGVDKVAALVRKAQRPVARAVRRNGGTPRLLHGVPAVIADLDEAQVDALETRADISTANLVSGNLSLMTDDSATSNRYPYIWGQANGTGTKVAVHEDDGVDNVNSFLNNATHAVTYWNPGSPDINTEGGHATHVAGVMASTNAWRRGGSYAASKILSANFNSFSDPVAMVNSAVWAVDQGADVLNMSWGGCSSGAQTFESRWVDYMQKAFNTNFVVSSGNTPNCGGSLYVASPSLGWNTTSVGSYWDHDTGLRTDDTESSFTEWKNPTDPNSGRTYEKPDVTAAGGELVGGVCRGVETTEVGGGVNASTCGTSFSAPDTSALIADIKQVIGHGSPEAAKAIVMAGASHNIVDGIGYTNCPAAPVANDCRDGAGAIDARQSILKVANPGNYREIALNDTANPTGSNIDTAASFIAGNAARVVLTFDSSATCSGLGAPGQSCSGDVLNADLDLTILDPNGNAVAGSGSFQNSSEVVDFTPTLTGTYTIRTHVFRFDAGTSTFMGLAWKTDSIDVNPLTGAAPFALGTTKVNQTTDKGHSYWDSYSVLAGGLASCSSLLSNETGLEKMYKITTTHPGVIKAVLSSIAGYPGVNSDVDVALIKAGGAANALNHRVVSCGETSLSRSQPAGTYYVVVDGFNGAVAKYSLRVTLT